MATTLIGQSCNLVIFGTKGDLARRKLFPSLYRLEKIGVIHASTRIVGVGRASWDVAEYIQFVRISLETFLQETIDENIWYFFSQRLDFCNLDVFETSLFIGLFRKLSRQKLTVYYFAMPPNTFQAICKGLSLFRLNQEPNRVVIEKPFGVDLISAKFINNQISKYFRENQIYRIDHYLGKEMVLNLLALRFANSLFISNWDNRIIDHIQITVAEEIGIEDRWEYFDKIGQMKDMIQSHILQILAIIAMSPPDNFTPECIRNEKLKILRALRIIDSNDIKYYTVRGQYTSGFIQGKIVPGYLEEHRAHFCSNTETFVSIRVDINNKRWFGVPFYLRTGKRLPIKYSEIVIYFKDPVINLFHDFCDDLPKNKLTIRLQPNEGIDLQIINRKPSLGHDYSLQIDKLDLDFFRDFHKKYFFGDYERLLLETMCGMQVLFVSRSEIEYSWKWIDSIVKSWSESNMVLELYRAGTWGPVSSLDMLIRDKRSWNNFS